MKTLVVLGLIFIVLKLTGFIAWSWWLVLLPIYGAAILWCAVVFGGLALIHSLTKN